MINRLAVAAGALLSCPAMAQTPAPTPQAAVPVLPPPGPIAIERPETRTRGKLTVGSAAFSNDGVIPRRHAKYGDNISPPLRWRGAPARTRGYALIVDDPDGRLKPVNHWIIWNIRTPALPEGIAAQPVTPAPLSARQGANTMGVAGWNGPRPPLGDPPHHYHFQVFALDTLLDLPEGANRAALLAAMDGHVLAKGDLIGCFGEPAPTPKAN